MSFTFHTPSKSLAARLKKVVMAIAKTAARTTVVAFPIVCMVRTSKSAFQSQLVTTSVLCPKFPMETVSNLGVLAYLAL
jgi:hypothetical protein